MVSVGAGSAGLTLAVAAGHGGPGRNAQNDTHRLIYVARHAPGAAAYSR